MVLIETIFVHFAISRNFKWTNIIFFLTSDYHRYKMSRTNKKKKKKKQKKKKKIKKDQVGFSLFQ